MQLYFVRHGKTIWNLEGRFQGANGDSPLLPESREILSQLGDHLSQVTFDHVYTSPLKRAQDSAELIMARNANPQPIIPEPALREWNLGRLEGQKFSVLSAIYPNQMAAFRQNLLRFDHTVFEAESVYQATKRVADFVATLDYAHDDKVLLVGHGACFTAAINVLIGGQPGELRQRGGLNNASLSILESEDGKHFELLKWNDTSYQNQS